MDEFLMAALLVEMLDGDEEEADPVAEPTRRVGNPLQELSETQFIRIFRVSKELFQFLVELVRPFMRPPARSDGLDIPTRVLAALRFFAAGSYQMDVGCNWFIGMSQASISRAIAEISAALNQPAVLDQYVKFPPDMAALEACRQRFYEKWGFPGVVGLIDRTHVAIVSPGENPEAPEHLFVNRKGYHSINVQLICDADLRIINVDATHPGSTHDAFMWNRSPVNEVLRTLHDAGHKDFYLLGDSGYPLRSWLLTPFDREPAVGTPEHRYNVTHKSVRSIIERCNGVLKARFRCCLRHRTLHYAPVVAARIINACVVLHNLCIDHNIPAPEDEEEVDINDGLFDLGPAVEDAGGPRVNPELVAGRNARARVIAARFQQP